MLVVYVGVCDEYGGHGIMAGIIKSRSSFSLQACLHCVGAALPLSQDGRNLGVSCSVCSVSAGALSILLFSTPVKGITL